MSNDAMPMSSLNKLLKCMWLRIEEDTEHISTWNLVQAEVLSSVFMHPSSVFFSIKNHIGHCTGVCMSVERLHSMVLDACEIWWYASKRDGSGIMRHGTVVVRNPFASCSSIDEALVKSDLVEALMKSGALDAGMSFVVSDPSSPPIACMEVQ